MCRVSNGGDARFNKFSAKPFPFHSVHGYLMASMALQVIWSFALACLDTYALARKAVLHNPILVTLFVVGDWVTATLTLAAAASSAGVIFLYTRDFGIWKGEECMKYQISVSLAFFSWIMVGISSLIMLWILGGG